MSENRETKGNKARHSPGVVVNHFALRFDKGVIDDFHLRVDDCYPGQLQALFCVTLNQIRETFKKISLRY